MVMEVIIPTSPDFDFNSARPSPRSSAPSTPKRFGDYYFSAPTSPTQISQFYRDFDDFCVEATGRDSPSSIPFGWEEKPGKSPKSKPMHEDDFAFDFSAESEKTTLPAEELFESGKIRPLKPPTPSRLGAAKKVFNPFAASPASSHKRTEKERERGREKTPSLSSTNSGRRAARSQSPRRVSKYPWEDELSKQSSSIVPKPAAPTNPTLTSSYSKSGGSSRKWRLKDFFLFRSASEGRAADKDPLKKYTALFRRHDDGRSVKGSSFRSIEGGSSSGSKRRGLVSAHELHYTVNRAVSEDLKKKTFLPYKQGILGRLAFNPAVHALANGFGFSRK